MPTLTRYALVLAAATGAACTDAIDDGLSNAPPIGATTGGEDTTFNHDNSAISIWDLVARLAKEGPPSFTSRVRGCRKLPYATLGNVLTSVGIDLDNPAEASAGKLYRDGKALLGAPRYEDRTRENPCLTTAGASREFDIFVAGADEIIAAVPRLERCKLGVESVQLFDAGNRCLGPGITCLIGVPARDAHIAVCNLTIDRASTPEVGKRIAVAALMAAAYTCE